MRSLRSGRAITEQQPELTGGPADNEITFFESLTRTIDDAAGSNQSVFAFKMQCCLLGLQQWSDPTPMSESRLDPTIDRLVKGLDPNIVLWRTENRDIVGFSTEPQSTASAERLGGQLLAAMTTALGDAGHEFVVSPRLGVAIVEHHDMSAVEVIEAASRTLRQTNFDTPFLVYNDYIGNRSRRQEQVGSDLPEALRSDQISVEFQPRVTAEDIITVGLEAFPRWHHPERGTIPTIEFLRVAERSGLLIELGNHIRSTAARTAAEWKWNQWLTGCRLWMNIAPVELCHQDLISLILELSANHPDVPIGFEVSDCRLLEDPVFARIFDRLQEAGVMLALDNIRSSTLSVGRVQRLPMSLLNLDGELVRSLPSRSSNRALVEFLCNHARSQGKMVTACGVETAEQLRVATSLGVDLLQGISISEPLPGEQMASKLRAGLVPNVNISAT